MKHGFFKGIVLMALVCAVLLASGAWACAEGDFRTVGATVTFGTYPQTESGEDRTAIEWQVLDYDEEANKSLLISKYVLDARPYHAEFNEVYWEKSALCAWMNSEFQNAAFSAEEQEKILLTPTEGDGEGMKLFLLNSDEATLYFETNDDRKCLPTDYAIAHGATPNKRMMIDGKGTCIWWLRSAFCSEDSAALVMYGGTLFYDQVINEHGGVRPALWLSLD